MSTVPALLKILAVDAGARISRLFCARLLLDEIPAFNSCHPHSVVRYITGM
ncbi:MAG: hypothetical protein GXY53_00305 [Desulfobulbus sp.]|nr:hypothetical protein [Desulfobulbus sp.]